MQETTSQGTPLNSTFPKRLALPAHIKSIPSKYRALFILMKLAILTLLLS